MDECTWSGQVTACGFCHTITNKCPRQHCAKEHEVFTKAASWCNHQLATPHDSRGSRLLKGDRVTYPGRRGSSLWMSEGIVEDIISKPASYPYDCTFNQLRVRRDDEVDYKGDTIPGKVVPVDPNNVIVLKEYRITEDLFLRHMPPDGQAFWVEARGVERAQKAVLEALDGKPV